MVAKYSSLRLDCSESKRVVRPSEVTTPLLSSAILRSRFSVASNIDRARVTDPLRMEVGDLEDRPQMPQAFRRSSIA